MPNRFFATLESKLAPSVPGCPLPTIIQYVRDAAVEVCERTLAWRYEQDPIVLSSGVYEYPYELPRGADVAAILHASINNVGVLPLTEEALHKFYPAWPDTTSAALAAPRSLAEFSPSTFVLAPVPDAASTYTVKMFLALKPSPDSDGMERDVFDACEPIIMHGALQHLLVLPNKSWTNNDLATYHAQQFVFKIAAKRARTNLGAARSSVTASMQPFS